MINLNLNYPISTHDSWAIVDSTKLQQYITCPRSYFYTYILGWRPERERNDLQFGVAWHEAMEFLLLNGYEQKSVIVARDLAIKTYREKFAPDTDELYSPKTPQNLKIALDQYVEKYQNDNFKVLWTEIFGSVLIAEDRKMYFKIDTVCKDGRGLFIMDHKTTKNFGRTWVDQWSLKIQIGLYTHALYCMTEDKNDVYGFVVNGVAFKNPPRMKKDGTPYANSGTGNEFLRLPVRKPVESLRTWLWTTNAWYDELERDFTLFSQCKKSDDIMKCFKMNPESCTKYWGCQYNDYCKIWANPLNKCEKAPIGFNVDFWDPQKEQSKAKKVVNL